MADHLLTHGDDPRGWQAHRERCAAARATGSLTHVDLDHDEAGELATALASTGGLFGGSLTVELRGLHVLDAAAAGHLAEQVADSGTCVLAYHPAKLAAPVVKRLAAVFTVEEHTAPPARQLPAHVRQMASDSGVQLTGDGATRAANRCGHDLGRLHRLFAACADAGIVRLDPRQLDLLLGTSEAPGAVWSLTDAVEAGDLGRVEATVGRVDVQPALGWQAKRAVQRAHAAEIAAGDDTAELAVSDWQARKLTAAAAGADRERRDATAAVEAVAAARGELPADDSLLAAALAQARGRQAQRSARG